MSQADPSCAPAAAVAEAASVTLSPAARLLYRDSLQSVLTFLPVADLRSANSVSKLWHTAVAAVRQADAARVARLTAQIRAGLFADEEEQPALARELRILSAIHGDASSCIPLFADPAVIARLVALLAHRDDAVVEDCAWVLTNVVSGSQTTLVVEEGAIPPLVKLLGAPNADVQAQAACCLGNIAGDGPAFRDRVLDAGAMDPMLAIARSTHDVPLLRTVAWALANLCGGLPQPHWERVRAAVPVIRSLLMSEDDEVIIEAARCLSYLSDGPHDGPHDRIQAVLDGGVAGRLVQLLGHPNPAVRVPALRAVGNLVTGDDQQTQTMINAGMLPAMLQLIIEDDPDEMRDTAWTVSNVTAGSPAQIESVFEAGLLSPLIALLPACEQNIQREVCWVIRNAVHRGTPNQIARLGELGALPALCNVLHPSTLADNLTRALDSIAGILQSSKSHSPVLHPAFLKQIDDCCGRDVLQLMTAALSEDDPACITAADILATYFPTAPMGMEEDEDDEHAEAN